MSRGRFWDYVASRARVLGALGALRDVGGTGGVEHEGGVRRPRGSSVEQDGLGPFPPLAVAGPRPLSRSKLDRLRWTGRHAGCEPQARHVQVAEVVRRVVRGGGRAAAVTVRMAPGLPVVAGDSRRMEAAIAGLVDHAIRRNPLGDRVLVRAEVAGTGPDPGSDRAAGRGGSSPGRARVEIRVSDHGTYEPPEARRRPPAGPRAHGPVGPALHHLVLAAGGRLAVEPTPGGGLTVVLLLDVAHE
ncbi:hypothetical protein [Streptomyces sp. FH025]|uniref:hypothetical protein n=1 Tax=Streptomyces sp. FH025 TaxID=2815937 RepID=UPI001A9EDB06|nr:hypothetical protein [Streptomyces sp. FH025]MBO1417273.1 hypothetical protein [Streptomyces sp. FH025]